MTAVISRERNTCVGQQGRVMILATTRKQVTEPSGLMGPCCDCLFVAQRPFIYLFNDCGLLCVFLSKVSPRVCRQAGVTLLSTVATRVYDAWSNNYYILVVLLLCVLFVVVVVV